MSHMGAGRPPKQGLSYHGSDTDYYEDFKIMELLDKYGPLGQTIYDVILKMVYRNGYYLEIPMSSLTLSVTKTIGSKWIRNRNLVLQVVQYCADIGLFDKDLLQQSVITSAGIQKRYAIATVRNKVKIEKYRLLEEESEKPLLSAHKNSISATEKGISATGIQNNDVEIPIKESKGNKSICTPEFRSAALEEAFQMYLLVRRHNHGDIIPEQVRALRDELSELSDDDGERLAIVKKATTGGWKNFYRIRREKAGKAPEAKRKNQFSNFEGRSYDMRSLEMQLVEGGKANGKDR